MANVRGTDAKGLWAVYVPLEIDGNIVRPQPPQAKKSGYQKVRLNVGAAQQFRRAPWPVVGELGLGIPG